MPVYVSLLRAVNLLSHNRVSMDRLKSLHESLGFDDVRTYIQSGNVIFRTARRSSAPIAESIEAAIKSELGITVAVAIRTHAELVRIAAGNPFLHEGPQDTKHLHVAFLTKRPPVAAVNALDGDQFLPERFAIKDREIYLFLPGGAARTKLSTAFFEKKLNVAVTVRNWRTFTTLCELSG